MDNDVIITNNALLVNYNKKERLWSLCEQFIADNRIYCGEQVYQTDRVIENAYDFIHHICKIVGFLERPEDEDY